MSTLNFDVFWRDRGAARGLQNLSKEADKTATSFEKVTKTTSGFGSLTGLAFKAAGVAAVGYGLKVASANEQAKISFTTMLGSAQKADVFLKQLQRFAATTPFEFPELQTAAQSLISAGVQANKVIPIMRTLGDVTAGMGTGSEGIKRATVAIQQMNAAGRITAEDLNQLRDAGIPVYDLLAAATKKSKSELVAMAQAGKLGRKELEQLMTALESGKGLEKFNGLMEQQSKSLAGMVSTLKDVSGQMLAGWLEPLFPALKASVGALADMSSGTKTALAIVIGGAATLAVATKAAYSLATAFESIGLAANLAKIAVAGVGGAVAAATIVFGIYASVHAKTKANIADFTLALEGETEAVNKNVRAVAAKQLQERDALEAAKLLGLSLETVTDAALGQEDALAKVNAAIDFYTEAGLNSADVDANLRVDAANVLSDAVRGTGSAYNKAVGDAKDMAAATAESEAAMGGMEKKTKDSKEALQQWRTEMFKSANAALQLAGSADAVEAAVDDATQSVKDNGKTLDNNTEKGRNNRQALRNIATASNAYRQQLIEQGAKTKTVTKATEESRQAFIKTAIKMGATKKEAKELADKYGLVDKKINELNNKTVTTTIKWRTNVDGYKTSFVGEYFGKKVGGPSRGVSLNQIVGAPTSPPIIGKDQGGPLHGVVNPDLRSNRSPDVTGRTNAMRGYAASRMTRYAADHMESSLDNIVGSSPTGSVGAYSAGMAGTIARLRAAGARSFTTYPGHHPSMGKARDVTPHSWKIANTARASKSVWYVIYQMKIASKNHGNMWRQYHPTNHRGDWQHRRHVHVAWYDKGGMLRPGWTLAYNGTKRNERVVPAGGSASGGNTYITINATHYSDAQALKSTLVDMNRRGQLEVIKR